MIRSRPLRVGGALRAGLLVACLVFTGERSVADHPVRSSSAGRSESAQPTETLRWPRIAPDYVGVVVPPNLAPLNFSVLEEGCEYRLRVTGPQGKVLELQQTTPDLRLPVREWKELLRANRGESLRWSLSVRDSAGDWQTYAAYETQVAREEIDPYVFYRRLQPLYSTYKHMGIYQRHLETFEERPVVRNERIGHGCVNCHTPDQGSTDRFAVSFRGGFGTPTLLIESNRLSRVDIKMGYLAWHPGGRVLAFSTNSITQFFHLAGAVNRDTYDAQSGIAVYHLASGEVEVPAVLNDPDWNVNWPAWSADGRTLYYARGPRLDFRDIARLRCDLLRVAYQPENNTWAKPEVIVSSRELRLSANQPRPSPDGRQLVFTGSDRGSFPLFYPDSDLFLLRMDSGEVERLTINSPHADTYASWSGNGRWLVFVSRGLDGVFARLMLAHIDAEAQFSKPLLLPQEDPNDHQSSLQNFNAPGFGRGPVLVSESDIVDFLNVPGGTRVPLNNGSSPIYSRE